MQQSRGEQVGLGPGGKGSRQALWGGGGGRPAGDQLDRQRLMETLARPCPAPHSRGRLAHLRFPPCPQVSDKFAFGLFDLDWDVFTQHIEGAINRVPVLEKTGIKSTVCGPGEWGTRSWRRWELAARRGVAGRRSVLGGRCCTSSTLQVTHASSWGAVVCPGPQPGLLLSTSCGPPGGPLRLSARLTPALQL